MLYAIAALLILIADQAVKYYVTLNIPLDEGVVTLIPGVMSLVNYHNTGAAFSMLSGGGARWAFVWLALCVTVGVSYLMINRKIKNKDLCWSLVLISAGAMGNAIDRAFYGYVVDMFRPDFMNFAIFNVADIFITLGGAALCIVILLMPSEKDHKTPALYEEDEPSKKQLKLPGIKLFSEKTELPENIRTSRQTGKLYGEKKPIDAKDPFGEFAKMPTSFDKPKAAEAPVPDSGSSDELVQQLQAELSLEAILDEFTEDEHGTA